MDREWLIALPKAEVHLHLEGCVPAGLLADAAARRGVDPGVETPDVTNLGQLLASLDRSCGLIDRAEDLTTIAYEAAERATASGARHIDVIVNPTHWPHFEGHLAILVEALDSGFAAAEADGHATAALCVSLKRTQTRTESVALVQQLLEASHPRVAGLSIDGDESEGSHNDRFAEAFALAAGGGLRRCAHAGESSGPEGVREAIDLLGAERIDHGVRSREDPALVAELVARAIPLDICPSSNVILGLVSDLAAHPVGAFERAGIRFSLNTDDPLLYGIDLVGEYERCARTFGWGHDTVSRIARTSIESCFAPPDRRAALLEDLDRFLAGPRI